MNKETNTKLLSALMGVLIIFIGVMITCLFMFIVMTLHMNIYLAGFILFCITIVIAMMLGSLAIEIIYPPIYYSNDL